ncbi:hypothetical protein QE429_000724 [Bacillus sp. SORGH_AS 510]|nr:hypothetical protein [Bacillus sp. SORGH_AS_0510]
MDNQIAEKLIRFIILFLSLAFGLLLHKIIFLIIGAIIYFSVTIYLRIRIKKSPLKG